MAIPTIPCVMTFSKGAFLMNPEMRDAGQELIQRIVHLRDSL
jgi:hypothetical protein